MILSPLLFHEKLTTPKVIGFLFVLVGIFLLNGKIAFSGGNTWGMLCGGLSAVLYFFMVTFNKKATHITGLENAVIQLLVSFLCVAVFVGCRQQFVIHIPHGVWGWIFLLGLVNTGVGCCLYFSSLSKLPVQTVAVCGYIEPLSAILFAVLLLGETMTTGQVIGAACILGGAMAGETIPKK